MLQCSQMLNSHRLVLLSLLRMQVVPDYVDLKEKPGWSKLPPPTAWDWLKNALLLKHIWARYVPVRLAPMRICNTRPQLLTSVLLVLSLQSQHDLGLHRPGVLFHLSL